MKKVHSLLLVSSCLASFALAPAAFAQSAPADEEKKEDKDEIVVTGTLIRGIAPTGSQTVSLDSTAIAEKAASSTNELLTTLPQFGSFNGQFQTDPRAVGQISINRINLRNLPGFNSASGSVTLVLVDGHRIAPVGTTEAAIDVDIVPGSILQKIDVVTDGGSSLYGADAVSGVVNFITRKKYDGIKIDLNYGLGTNVSEYNQWDGTITAGTSWETGSALIAATYAGNSNVRNGDTDWARIGTWTNGVRTPLETQCLSPVGTTSTYVFLPIFGGIWTNDPRAGGSPSNAIGSRCDGYNEGSYLPKQRRINVFGSVNQEFGDNVEFGATAYYAKRDTTYSSYPIGFTSSAQPAPTGAPGSPGAPASSPVTISTGTAFSFGANAAYVHRQQTTGYETWGVTPEVKVNIGSDWQSRASLYYGRSTNFVNSPSVNGVLAGSLIRSGAINPLNVAAASATNITNVLNWEGVQDTRHKLFTARLVIDGPLFTLPAGDVKIAFGAEYQKASAQSRAGAGTVGFISGVALNRASRDTKSLFGEINLPVFDMLDLSASVRYDDYSSFGSTTNPTFGARFTPVEGFSIFGHWSKSFNAPTVLDQLAIATARWIPGICPATAPCVNTNAPAAGPYVGGVLLINGASNSIQPQTAKTWVIGTELAPTDGLRVSLQYYNIDFRGILGAADPTNPAANIIFADKYFFINAGVTNPDAARFLALSSDGAATSALIGTSQIAYVLDRRISNLNSAKLEGLDFTADYRFSAGSGDLSFGVAGNVILRADTINRAGVVTDALRDGTASRANSFTASANVGWSNGTFTTRLTYNYSGGYNSVDSQATPNPYKINPFGVANLFLGYNFGEGSGALSGTSLRLTVDNLFDKEPQIVPFSAQRLSYARWSLGRVIKFGISREF